MKPYPAYKDSGVPWLGQIPAHWDLHRAKFLFRYRKDLNTNGKETNILSLTLRGVVNNDPNNPEGLVPKDYSTYQKFNAGDLVFKLIDLENRQTSRVGLVHEDGIMSPAYLRLIPRNGISTRYFYHQFFDLYLRGVFNQLGAGVRATLGSSDLLNLRLSVPSLEEQIHIARFLDAYDRLTRRYIRAQRRLIALLTEQKQALIQQAVTRGLDPDVPLKDSGIEWLGKIPAHWEVSRVKNEFECLDHRRIPLSATERGAMKQRLYDYYGASGVIDRVDDYLFDDELLLLAEDGANLVLRNLPLAIIARGKFWVNNHAHILKPKRGNLEYLANVMEMVDYRIWISGAAQPKLTQDRLMAIPIPVPPVEEQELIIVQLSNNTAALRAAITRTQRQIELVREYRTRLIADVVTGKLDVRGAALPDLPVDDADFDDAADLDDEDNFKNALNEEGSIEEVPDDES